MIEIKRTIDQDADKVTEIIMSGAGLSVRDFIRRAYLLGRADQAAHNLDTLIKTCRSQAEAKEQG